MKVIQFTDPPSANSYGSTPIIVEVGGVLKTRGSSTMNEVLIYDADRLVEWGQHRRIEPVEVPEDLRDITTLRAGWVGAKFEKLLNRVGGPTIAVRHPLFELDDGLFWFDSFYNICKNQQRWLFEAAAIACKFRDRNLAYLMKWTLPDHVQTRATQWYVLPESRDTNLKWWVKLDNDNHRRSDPTNVEEMEANLRDWVERILENVEPVKINPIHFMLTPVVNTSREVPLKKLLFEHTATARCLGCWDGSPKTCDHCGGKVHTEFGDYDSHESFYLQYECESCGSTDAAD